VSGRGNFRGGRGGGLSRRLSAPEGSDVDILSGTKTVTKLTCGFAETVHFENDAAVWPTTGIQDYIYMYKDAH
jgi:hypothetical protein